MPIATLMHLEVPDLRGISGASDAELIETMRAWARARREVDAGLATLAGVVAARSGLELGHDGLAQRAGARTADGLVSQLTGTTGVEADLADAAHSLLTEAGGLPPEKVARHARELRDELDEAGIADREAVLREKRFLRLIPQSDGMTKLIGLLDPESAALVTDAVDAVTSPRRGGPRFIDPDAVQRADAVVNDERSTEQLALDALVEMVRIAAAADRGRVFGVRVPAVRVHVSLADLDRRAGAAHLEGQTTAVSVATAQRIGCAEGLLPILFDDHGKPLKLGRTKRSFTEHQRTVLGAIWGGCAHPGCDRPPSWTEAHHINEWARDGGNTDIDDGILLCRHHHLLVHNNGWRVQRAGARYELLPPPGDALHREPITLIPKNPVYRRARASAAQRANRLG